MQRAEGGGVNQLFQTSARYTDTCVQTIQEHTTAMHASFGQSLQSFRRLMKGNLKNPN